MRHIVFFLVSLMFLVPVGGYAQCPVGDIKFTTQAEIDNFPIDYPGCSAPGTIEIYGDDIVSLQGLSNIDTIFGNLEIAHCGMLTNLHGLDNVKYISGDVRIKYNDSLFDLQGLNGLMRIGGDLNLPNGALSSLEGLNNLNYIAGDLFLGFHTSDPPTDSNTYLLPALTDLSGLDHLDSIGGDFVIKTVPLTTFAGVSQLEKVGGDIFLEACNKLVNFEGLSSLKEVNGILLSPVLLSYNTGNYLVYYLPAPNNSLQGFTGLSSLAKLNILDIGDNPALTSFNGLQNITELGTLKITQNTSLTNFDGLNNLTKISDKFIVGGVRSSYDLSTGNITNYAAGSNISSFSGLDNLKEVGDFSIDHSNHISDFSGLENLEIIHGHFSIGSVSLSYPGGPHIASDSLLSSFKGLSSLRKIEGGLFVRAVNEISDFTSLHVDTIAGGLFVNSSNMESLEGLSSTYIGHSIILGSFFVPLMDNFYDLSQLAGIDSVHGDLFIVGLDSIIDLNGLEDIKYVQRDLIIAGNENLGNVDALSNLEYVGRNFSLGEYIYIIGFYQPPITFPNPNPHLQSIEGLSKLKTVGGSFTFAGNNLIKSLSPLSSLESIGGNVYIGKQIAPQNLFAYPGIFFGNDQLEDISVLKNVFFDKKVYVVGNPALTSLEGIGNRDSLDELSIVRCDSLLTLSGLTGIKQINNLAIGYYSLVDSVGNNSLQSLQGLDDDTYVDFARIVGNPNLNTCGYLWLCDAILRDQADVLDNGPSCTTDQMLAICSDYSISGTIFYDYNQNQLRDPNESGIPGRKVWFDPPGHTLLTNQDGEYLQLCHSGTVYQITWIDTLDWSLTTDSASYQTSFTPGLPSNHTMDFGILPNFSKHAGNVNLSSDQTRCNTDVNFFLRMQNTGTYMESGHIRLQYDSTCGFVSATPSTGLTVDTGAHTLTWAYDSLYPFQYRDFSIVFTMPDQNSTNSPIHFLAEMDADSAGTDNLLDAYHYDPIVLCSFDPNDKQVMPPGVRDEHYTLHDQKLTYTIRFQNTGNAPAIDVRIKDTLDANLDINTLRIVNSSFPVQTAINGQVLEFFFKDIWLPDSTSNEPASHGFVTYEIQPKPGLPDYTEIKNTAHIIFDFNDAIVTNTTTNTMVTMIPDAVMSPDVPQISITPNPAREMIYVSAGDRPVTGVRIYNNLGECLRALSGARVDVSDLPPGLYWVKVQVGEAIGMAKMVKL